MKVPFLFRFKRPSHASGRKRPRALLRLEALEGRTLPTVVAPIVPDSIVNGGLPHEAIAATTPDVAVANSGNLDVVFTQNTTSGTNIIVRRFTADGGPQATNPTITVASAATGTLGLARIGTVPGSDAFVVAYVGPTPGGFQSVFARRFGADGNPIGDVIQVATTDFDTANQIEPALAVAATGEFFVSWTDRVTPTNGDIRARGFQSDNNPFAPADVAIVATAANEHESAIAVSTGSRNRIEIGITYTSDGPDSTQNVFYDLLFSRTLGSPPNPVQVNVTPGAASHSSLTLTGSVTVAWVDSTTGGPASIRARRSSLISGFNLTGPELVVDDSPGDKSQPRVASDFHDGRYLIAYIDGGASSSQAVFKEFDRFDKLQTTRRAVTNHTAEQTNVALANAGNGTYAFVVDDKFTGQNEPWLRTFQHLPTTFFAVGGAPGRVRINKVSDGSLVADFAPFGPNYTGPVSVAFGDVNGDGFPDLVTGALTGNPDVRIFDGRAIFNGTFNPSNPDASRLLQFFAYGLNFNIGAYVAVGNINGNGYADLVTGASAGNPHIKMFNGQALIPALVSAPREGAQAEAIIPVPQAEFFAYGLQFNVGATVAIGDIFRSGYGDIVTGATIGNPHVKVFRGKDFATDAFDKNNPDASIATQFFAYGTQFNLGVNVAVGDINGDRNSDIITGATFGNPHVKVFNGAAIANGTFNAANPDASLLASFFAYDLQFHVGVTVGAGDFENTGFFDIITGASSGAPHYRIVKGFALGSNPPPALRGIEGIPGDIRGGVYVGA